MFLKRRIKKGIFKLPYKGFGVDATERIVEIPWALSVYAGESRVLEVGSAHAELEYINGLRNLGCKELYGIDVVDKKIEGMLTEKGDIRRTNFPDDYFDLIFSVSTIEHIGRDNSIYFEMNGPIDKEGDFKTAEELRRILRKNGKLIITAPYGKKMDYGWFIHYDEERWNRLKRRLGLKLIKEDFFIYKQGWFYCGKKELANIEYKDNNAPAACGLVCALFVNR